MVFIIGLAVGLMLGGLAICWLSPSAGSLKPLAWWAGIILFVVGFVLFIAPIIVWLAAQLRSMLGA